MIERAFITALVAFALIGSATYVATGLKQMANRVQCAFDHAAVCVMDKDKQK